MVRVINERFETVSEFKKFCGDLDKKIRSILKSTNNDVYDKYRYEYKKWDSGEYYIIKEYGVYCVGSVSLFDSIDDGRIFVRFYTVSKSSVGSNKIYYSTYDPDINKIANEFVKEFIKYYNRKPRQKPISRALLSIVERSNIKDNLENDMDNDTPRYELFGEWGLGLWEPDSESNRYELMLMCDDDLDETDDAIQNIYDNGATSEIISRLVKKFGRIITGDGEDVTDRVIAGPSINESRKSRNFQMRTRR